MHTSTTHHKADTSLRFPTVVTRKGQITIPAPIRDALGIKTGDTINVSLEGEEVTLEPALLSLAESYQAISALVPPRSWKEIKQIAYEDHADEAMKQKSPA